MKKKKMMKVISLVFLALFLLILSLWIIRRFSEKQLDDINPEIPCEKELLEKADAYFIIPKFNNKSIAENKAWCNKILQSNKKLYLHGVYHSFNEFLEDRDEKYLQEGIDTFEQCFNFTPEKFKPPQLAISTNNKKLVKEKMILGRYFNEVFHKVYHCSDTGEEPNRFIDLF